MTDEEVFKIAVQYTFTNSLVIDLYRELPEKFKEEIEFRKVLTQLTPGGDYAMQAITNLLYAENYKARVTMEALEEMKKKFNKLFNDIHNNN